MVLTPPPVAVPGMYLTLTELAREKLISSMTSLKVSPKSLSGKTVVKTEKTLTLKLKSKQS